MTPAALAVDAGQTEVRAALCDERGPRTASAPGVVRMDGRGGREQVAAALVEAIGQLGPLPALGSGAAIGLSGFEAASEDDLRRLSARLRERLGLERLCIASDGLTALLGAIGARSGAAVAAGTGAVCVAHRDGRLAKVDGWGSLLGDAGSGFAIGRAGLDAALRHADGRPGSAALLRAAEARFGPVGQLPRQVYGAAVPTRAVAAFAADVAAEAAHDEIAAGVLGDAGRELAITGCAALARLFEPGEPALLSYAGSVFHAGAPLLEPFLREVTDRRPGTEIVAPAGDPLAGAVFLAERGAELPAEPGLLWREA